MCAVKLNNAEIEKEEGDLPSVVKNLSLKRLSKIFAVLKEGRAEKVPLSSQPRAKNWDILAKTDSFAHRIQVECIVDY
ncbi:hypothetical protein AAHA92_21061 [Salvia divinorum]|uniref:Uncharacterized protein n=1 Tax=Salvia divinorum TaxID=28513 RepID=A0ABD1GJ80_SALDI